MNLLFTQAYVFLFLWYPLLPVVLNQIGYKVHESNTIKFYYPKRGTEKGE